MIWKRLQPQKKKKLFNEKKIWKEMKISKNIFFGNTNWDLISGILIQLAAATAASGTNRPTIGGAF